MKRSLSVLAAVAAVGMVLGGTSALRAETYNGDVADTGAPNHYLYFGSGNPNGDFAVASDASGTTLGLRADYAFGNLVAGTQSNGTGSGEYYTVDAGTVYDPGTNSQIAKWDFVFSIDTGTRSLAEDGPSANLTVTAPNGAGSLSFNPLGIPDNGLNGSIIVASSVAQNAENITFGATPGDPNALGTWEFDLSFTDSSGPLQDIIYVNVVPLPASAWSGLALLGGLGLFGAVKRHRKQMA